MTNQEIKIIGKLQDSDATKPQGQNTALGYLWNEPYSLPGTCKNRYV